MRYDASPERASDQVRAVAEAQTEIKVFAKLAAEMMYTQRQFIDGVSNILKRLMARLTLPNLREKCRVVLPRFALRMFITHKKLITSYAEWFFIVKMAMYARSRDAPRVYEDVSKYISPKFRDTPAFKLAMERLSDSVYNRAIPLQTLHKNYMKLVEEQYALILLSEPKDKYGENVNLRNIAEMEVRHRYQMNMVEGFKESGVKLVYIEPHANCSKRCEGYQVGGKYHPSGLYSLDQSSGVTEDGIKYIPLEFAMNDEGNPNRDTRYQNGCISGFNCRHRLIPYQKGNQPMPIPAEVIERQRAIERQQREYEREIRLNKEAYFMKKGVNPEQAEHFRKQAQKLTEEYKEYSRKNEVPFYRDRLRSFGIPESGRTLLKQDEKKGR